MGMVSSVFFSVLFNKSKFDELESSRRIKQVDSISYVLSFLASSIVHFVPFGINILDITHQRYQGGSVGTPGEPSVIHE